MRGWVAIQARVCGKQKPEDWKDELGRRAFSGGVHLALQFEESKIQGENKIRLKGMSGCGVWDMRASSAEKKESKLWKPDLRLLGILLGHRVGRGFVKATKISVVKNLLEVH
jgi:hypothetical protein